MKPSLRLPFLKKREKPCRKLVVESFTINWLERNNIPLAALECIMGKSRRVVIQLCREPEESPAPKRCTCMNTGEPYPDVFCTKRWMSLGNGWYIVVGEAR